MSEQATLAAGAAAWTRLRSDGRRTFEDWIVVGQALQIGRSVALKAAGTNRPIGSKYNRIIFRWLIEAGLDGITGPERYRIGPLIGRLPEIMAWREGLSEQKLRSLNSPSATWFAWRRSCGEKKMPKAQPAPFARQLAEANVARKGRALYWPQDALRRAHQAMLDSRSTDLLTLARVALQAAIRCEADLLALLPPVSLAKSRRQQAVAMSALPRGADMVGAAGHVR
jgi:hypothetical protein